LPLTFPSSLPCLLPHFPASKHSLADGSPSALQPSPLCYGTTLQPPLCDDDAPPGRHGRGRVAVAAAQCAPRELLERGAAAGASEGSDKARRRAAGHARCFAVLPGHSQSDVSVEVVDAESGGATLFIHAQPTGSTELRCVRGWAGLLDGLSGSAFRPLLPAWRRRWLTPPRDRPAASRRPPIGPP